MVDSVSAAQAGRSALAPQALGKQALGKQALSKQALSKQSLLSPFDPVVWERPRIAHVQIPPQDREPHASHEADLQLLPTSPAAG